jgi:hypothetical protein
LARPFTARKHEQPAAQPADPTAELRPDLSKPANQIIGYSERLQEEAKAGGHNTYVSDLQKIQVAARQLLGLINTKVNVEALSGVVSPAASAHTVAHRRANQPLGDGRGETGFFARFNGHVLVADNNEKIATCFRAACNARG